MKDGVRAVLMSAGSWYLRQTAAELQRLDALAGLYVSDKNSTGINPALFHRCWPFHLATVPFCLASGHRINRWDEMFWRMVPIWSFWLKRQNIPPCNVVQAIGPFATEAFDIAERLGAVKIFDAANSHPITQTRLMEREYRIWLPGTPLPRVTEWYVKRATRDIERADIVLCPSTFVRESMLENGVPENKCELLPFGASPETFSPRISLPATPRFVCVGTMAVRKGHQYLFPAFAKLKKDIPDAELICIGDIKESFLPIYRKWRHTFTHIPYMTHPQLSTLLQTCTAFVLPSIEEGYARVLAEALASGLPVIATHESGATTTIRHNEEGLIIPRASVESLTEAMQFLALDRDMNTTMGNKAGFLSRSLTLSSYGDQLYSIYLSRTRCKKTKA